MYPEGTVGLHAIVSVVSPIIYNMCLRLLFLTLQTNLTDFLAIEQHEQNHTHRNAGIGEVKDGTEENELIAAKVRYPFRPGSDNEREIEHIDHLTH